MNSATVPIFNSIRFDGLAGVGKAELAFSSSQRVFTLFGTNGVGKTKCLEAMYVFLLLGNKDFLRKPELFTESELPFRVAEDSNGNRWRTTEFPVFPRQVWLKEKPDGFHSVPVVLLGATNRSRIEFGSPTGLLGTFDQRREQYFDAARQAIKSSRLNRSGMDENVHAWFVRRAQSVNPYQKDSDNRRSEIDTVLGILSEIDDRIDPNTLQIDGSGRVFLSVDGTLRELSHLSSGFASLVKVVQSIVAGFAAFTNEPNLRNVRGIVLIDEIESHFHVRWQATLLPKLKGLFPNTYFFIATHSPVVLAQLQQGEAYLLHRDLDGVVRSTEIEGPSRRAFVDLLDEAFGVDLNAIKRAALDVDDQSAAKTALLQLLRSAEKKQ